MTEMIQKRTTTVLFLPNLFARSGGEACHAEHALAGHLKEATWITTDNVSRTKRPPTIASTISCLVATAMAPNAPQRQRPGIAHEDHGRRRVEPEEAETCSDQRAADDGEFGGSGDVVDL